MKFREVPFRLLLIEDDELSREVLTLQMAAQGYLVEAADSGDAALLQLRQTRAHLPDAVLTDLQLPGIAGQELLQQLRAMSDANMTLVAMSASKPKDEILSGFDGFLLKPFTMTQLDAALRLNNDQPANKVPITLDIDRPGINPSLDEPVYLRFAGSMPALQLHQFYTLCLDDVTARLGRMRVAATNADDPTYRREAHAIKGGCSMVGATELHNLASTAEEGGLLAANHLASLDEMLIACERLRRILIAREERATN